MTPSPIIKDTCLLCGDGMSDDCNLCWRTAGGPPIIGPTPDLYGESLRWWQHCLIFAATIIMVAAFVGLISLTVTPPAPAPTRALPTQALYESQIRELTHEILARESELDSLVAALATTEQERDAAIARIRLLQRGQEL